MSTRKFELDQHFLKSPKLALMLIGHSNIRKNDTVVEIGAGSGVITTALSKRCKKVIAIEPDHETAEKLRENLRKFGSKNVEIVEKDFRDVKFPSEPYKIFANPPFRYSSEIFYKLLNLENQGGKIVKKQGECCNFDNTLPKSIYLILQKNLALKLIQTDRHYTSQLGYLLQEKYTTKIRFPLRKTDFTPPPAVDTVLFEAKLISTQPQDNKS
ncbi:RsmD family RNA methyltransferase [Candidatus Saccharibacteria bacterium]|nr:RsmD family RNA methyltransferase [Candidatus Saccharibacteria bacterium]